MVDKRTASSSQSCQPQGKPVILFSSYTTRSRTSIRSGLGKSGDELITGPAWQRWERRAFEEKYGGKTIEVVASSDAAQRRGGYTGDDELMGAKANTKMTVKKFIASFYQASTQENPLYFFKRIEKHFPELFGDLDPSKYFADRQFFAYGPEQRRSANLFCFGGSNSSTFVRAE